MFKKKKTDDLGQPVMNLTIQISVHDKTLGNGYLNILDEMEMMGFAAAMAKKIKGDWSVTEKGYLGNFIPRCKQLPHVFASLHIDENLSALSLMFRKMQLEKAKDSAEGTLQVHFHYDKSKLAETISFDKNGFFLPGFRLHEILASGEAPP